MILTHCRPCHEPPLPDGYLAAARELTAAGVDWWHTATLYGLTHAGVALAAGLSGRGGKIAAGGWLVVAGAVIFAGTLYAMALGAPRWFGAITPVGGVLMIGAWLVAAWRFSRF